MNEQRGLEAQALNAAANGVVIADARTAGFPIIYVNAGFERITGYATEDVIGKSCSLLQGPESGADEVRELTIALGRQRQSHTTILNYKKDGTPFWNEIYLTPIFDEAGELQSYIGIQNDVSDRVAAQERVRFLAFHDALTGLPNRIMLRRAIERAVERNSLDQTASALMFVDLDNFKDVNDSLGHEAGDELLKLVAGRLRAALPDQDLIARRGGDEFLVLVSDIDGNPTVAAERSVRKMRSALRPKFALGDAEVAIRFSAGISIYPQDASSGAELMRHADTTMYSAKRGGGGYRFAPRRPSMVKPAMPIQATATHRSEFAGLMAERAIDPVFQPIVDLQTRKPVAYESLARGPIGSPLETPGPLFAAAVASDRLAELDWTCRVRTLEAVRDAGLGRDFPVFLNAEPETLASPCPEDLVASWSKGHDKVFVEITERALTSRPSELLSEVERIRERGWGIALDDVGADVRSLALMPLLQPDVVKLDLGLIQAQPSIEIASIVNAVRAEQERTGAAVVAEGIETEEHLTTALALGATLGQGWLFGRPGPLEKPEVEGAPPSVRSSSESRTAATPYELVAPSTGVRVANKRILLSTSMHLEHQALRVGEGAVVLSAFQHADRFTPETYRRYTAMAGDAALVAAFGTGMNREPAPGVRGADIEAGDPLEGEWSVVVLGPHFAGALVAVDLGDSGPDMDRRFDYAMTYDRELVVSAATTLARRIAPMKSDRPAVS